MTAPAPSPPAPTATSASAPSPTKAAPAPAPTKPAAPTNRPEIKAPQESDDPFRDAFADIDTMETGKKPEPKKEAAKEANPTDVDGADTSSETATTKIGSKDAESAKSATNATEDTKTSSDAKPLKVTELRTAYEGLKKKVKEEYEPKAKRADELAAKLKEIEARGDDKTSQERIAAIEKRNAELENHIRFVDYEKSKEYQDEYDKPYQAAWAAALRELKGLTMSVEDPNGGEATSREVTAADIAYFANLNPADRRKEINRLFPEDKEEVKRHINQISLLAEKSEGAKAKAKQEAESHAKTQAEQQKQYQANRAKLWKETNESLATKYPKWFAKAEDDQEGNTIFDRGTALADLAFNPADLTPERVAHLPKMFKEQIESGKPFSAGQLTQLHSIIRNKASNHDRLAHQNKALSARVEELEKSLKEYEESGPDRIPAGGARTPAVNGIADAGEELEAIARKHN